MAQKLADDGWNIKPRTSRDDDGDAGSYLPVTVRYDNFPPKIYMISGKVKTLLTEESVGNLDFADIVCADLTINPSKWDDNGRRRIKAYLQTMYAKIQDKNRKKMAEALERNFYRSNQTEEESLRPVSETEAANNMLLLQKLAENPETLQMLLAMVQPAAR